MPNLTQLYGIPTKQTETQTPSHQPEAMPTDSPKQLLLGLGGTGKAVVLRVNQDEAFGSTNQVQVGVIDGDPDLMGNLKKEQGYLINDVPARELVTEIKKRPRNWPGAILLGKLAKLSDILHPGTDNLERGSPDGERTGGMLMFLFHWVRHYMTLMTFFMGLVQNLTDYAPRQMALNGHGEPSPTHSVIERVQLVISLFISACGGTGSALAMLVLDILAFILRRVMGITRMEFEFHVVLPGLFVDKSHNFPAMLAKTYAFFVELRARFRQPFPPLKFGRFTLSRSQSPAWVYIYDAINAAGRWCTSREDMADIIAQVWRAINIGPLADPYRSILETKPVSYPNHYSAAGIGGYEFPVERLLTQFGHQTAQETLNALLYLPPDAAERGQAHVQDFLRRHPEWRSLPAMRVTVERKPVGVTLSQLKQALKQVPRPQLPAVLKSFLLEHGSETEKALERVVSVETQRLGELLVAEIQAIVNQPGGLAVSRYFLQGLATTMTERMREISQQQTRLMEEQGQLATASPLSYSLNTRMTLKFRDEYQRWGHAAVQQLDDVKRLPAQLQLAHQLVTMISSQDQTIAGMARTLRDLAGRVAGAAAEWRRNQRTQQSTVFESVVTDRDIEAMYAQYESTVLEQMMAGLRFGHNAQAELILHYHGDPAESGRNRWQLASEEGLARHLAYCRQGWQPVGRDWSLEGFWQARGVDSAKKLANLLEKAAPWVAVREAKMVPAEQRLILVGSETGGQFFGQPNSELTFVATGDKTRIVCLSTLHGLDVFKLHQTPGWQEQYQETRAEDKQIHVMEVDLLTPVLAEIEQEMGDQTDDEPPALAQAAINIQ